MKRQDIFPVVLALCFVLKMSFMFVENCSHQRSALLFLSIGATQYISLSVDTASGFQCKSLSF